MLIKRDLNIQTPYRISLSITTAKMPFLSSLLISLHYKSVKGVFYIRTNISIGRDCLADIPIELINIPIELIDILIELIDISIKVK